ncbi:TIGR03089 family protein [Angustibacter luteus]|uniref:TIGR03089 family protein n=1 Tax=Angustibacter luteus TaxID=658456 RepID=A0ABW1JGA0_9ACTN
MSASTPAHLLAELVAQDGTRPRLTWYDDADGPTRGERIELSARVLATWTAKAANLLVDDLGVERGDVVALDLPAHWRTTYWALAVWRVGAVVSLGDDPAAAVRVTATPTAPTGLAGTTAAQQVAVSLPALARRWTPTDRGPADLPAGVVDEAADLASHPDVFVPYDEPEPDDPALRHAGGEWAAGGLVDAARGLATERGWPPGARVAVTAQDVDDVLLALLAAWSTGGSAVLVRPSSDAATIPEPVALQARWDAERVTSAYGPPGRPASRP